jgi:hypothetical protein
MDLALRASIMMGGKKADCLDGGERREEREK